MRRLISEALDLIAALGIIALGLFVLAVMFPGAPRAQTVCIPVDRYGFLCGDLPREMWVQEAVAGGALLPLQGFRPTPHAGADGAAETLPRLLSRLEFARLSASAATSPIYAEPHKKQLYAQPYTLAHDGYNSWKQPPQPEYSCCNNYDCAPVEARFDEKRGVYQAKIDGVWRDIPPEIILDPKKPENHSPDGGYHACWVKATGKLLCFREAEPKT